MLGLCLQVTLMPGVTIGCLMLGVGTSPRTAPACSFIPPWPVGSVHHQLGWLVKGVLAIKAYWVISKPKQWFFIETHALCYGGEQRGR